MTNDEVRELVRLVTEKKIEEAFYLIGISLSNRDGLDAIQSDRAFVRRMRLLSEARSMSWTTGVVGAFLAVAVTIVGAWLLGVLKLGKS